MTAGSRVITYLDSRGVVCALIGGLALGAHGIARATLDTDVLVADAGVLDAEFWAGLDDRGSVEIRRGDSEDPLLGVVRFVGGAEPVDVIVGRAPWTEHVVNRRIRVLVEGQSLPVVDKADLILLKLFAGGPQDLLDVRLLLAADSLTLKDEVESRLAQAPDAVRGSWESIDAP